MLFKILKFLYKGLTLSLLSGSLIAIGISNGTEPTCWILWGIAGALGLPFNIGALFILHVSLWGFFHVVQYNETLVMLYKAPIDLLFWEVIGSAIIGSHINGVILSNIILKYKTNSSTSKMQSLVSKK